MGLLDSIDDLRSIVLGLFLLFAFLKIAPIFFGMDFTDPDSADENIKKIAEKSPDVVIPAEVTLIQTVSNKVKNPYVLTILILGIMWFFGYFNKK